MSFENINPTDFSSSFIPRVKGARQSLFGAGDLKATVEELNWISNIEKKEQGTITITNKDDRDPEVNKVFNTISEAVTFLRATSNVWGYNVVIKGDTIEEIPANGFGGCTLLESIRLCPSIKKIGNSAFAGCNSLDTLILSEGLTTIENSFIATAPIRALTIPSTVETIGATAFNGVSVLNDVYIKKDEGSIEGAPWGLTSGTVHWVG